MIWSGKMILIGIVYLLMLFIPNMIWVKNQPIDYEKYVISENKILQIFERVGEILVCCFLVVSLSGFGIKIMLSSSPFESQLLHL